MIAVNCVEFLVDMTSDRSLRKFTIYKIPRISFLLTTLLEHLSKLQLRVTMAKQIPLTSTSLTSLPKIAEGKVRDLYQVDANTLLFVASDRISAYDVIMENVSPPYLQSQSSHAPD